jgi:putative nucleotidyltransferase with HDIG domain
MLARDSAWLSGPCHGVFIVDDDNLVLCMMTDALESAGYDTTTFQDPRAALRALDTQHPTVIVSDYAMPSMDGVSFLAQSRQRVPDATRLLCTAASDFDVAMAAVNSGNVYGIVRKPWRPDELLEMVAAAAQCALQRGERERLACDLTDRNSQLLVVKDQLEKTVQDRTESLLGGLVAALDCRDSDTQWHSRRVARYARRLAEQLGVREPELTIVEQGALLHDVGKIGVRDELLRKPGALTPAERDEMSKHAVLGWSLLHAVEYLRPASTLVLQHHEKWDGGGYPANLQGEDIALGARIFHVVDALDAITSDRPYRKARPFSVAFDEILRLAGSHFDPRAVQAFREIDPREWESIRREIETVAILSTEAVFDYSVSASPVLMVSASPAAEQRQWSKKRLGEILVELGVIDWQRLDSALEYQRWHRCKIGVALRELEFASEEQILTTLARKLGYDRIYLDSLQLTPAVAEAIQFVPEAIAKGKGVVPVACDRTTLTVALLDPANLALADELAFRSGRRVRVLVAGEGEVTRAVARLYSRRAPAPGADLDTRRDNPVQIGPLASAI